jgi:4-hydroxy-4-methyl-2-oxoglutarate aldolase
MKPLALLFLFVSALIAQGLEFTSSDVSDAAEHLTGHRAHMTNEIRLLAGERLAGPAVTLRLVRDEKASSAEVGLAAIKLLENAPPGSVVVAALDDEKGFAVFGATFAALAKSRKLAGFVVDGSVRDLPDLRALAFPTSARGTAPGSAGGHYRLDGTNVAVRCGGIEVMPGDYVVADDDGVAVAPKDRYQEVIVDAKRRRREKEALLPLIEKNGSYIKAVQARNAAKPQ